MNRDQVEKEMKQQAKNTMNNEPAAIVGKYEQFVGILQKKYSAAVEGAERQVDGLRTIIEQFRNPVGS